MKDYKSVLYAFTISITLTSLPGAFLPILLSIINIFLIFIFISLRKFQTIQVLYCDSVGLNSV